MNSLYNEPTPRVIVETTPVDREADYTAIVDRLGFDIADFRTLMGADDDAETVSQRVELVAPIPVTATIESSGPGRLVFFIPSDESENEFSSIRYEDGEISIQTDLEEKTTPLAHDLKGIQTAQHLAATLQKVLVDHIREKGA